MLFRSQEFIKAQFDYIRSYTKDIFTLFEEKVILAQGELISTNMVTNYLQEQGVNAILLPALVNFTAITQSLTLPVPHVTVHDTSFHKAWERYGPIQIKAINRFYEDGPEIALYVLAELAVSHAIRIVQDERSIPATKLNLCRIMTKLISGPRLIPYRLNPHIRLLTDGHEALVRQGR